MVENERKFTSSLYNLENRCVGPLVLIKVDEGMRGKNKAVIIQFKGFDHEIACSFSDGYEARLEKCRSLINQEVMVFSSKDISAIDSGWFSEIEPFQKNQNHPTHQKMNFESFVTGKVDYNFEPPPSNWPDTKMANEFIITRIVNVEKVAGNTLEDYWQEPMWKIETLQGHFIQAAKNIDESLMKPKSLVQGVMNSYKHYIFLNDIKSVPDPSGWTFEEDTWLYIAMGHYSLEETASQIGKTAKDVIERYHLFNIDTSFFQH